MRLFLSVFLITLGFSCKSVQVAYFGLNDINSETFNSIIECTVLSTIELPAEAGEHCAKHDCMARVQLDKINQKGRFFGGKYTVGDTLDIFFVYTVDETSKLFPELNKPLQGLKKGSSFRAELFEEDGRPGAYSIFTYAIISKP